MPGRWAKPGHVFLCAGGQKGNRLGLLHTVVLLTGPLIMGIIGDQHRLDAATISDTVNTASRIESLTKHYGVSILLSEDSLKKMENPDMFNLRYWGQGFSKREKESGGNLRMSGRG